MSSVRAQVLASLRRSGRGGGAARSSLGFPGAFPGARRLSKAPSRCPGLGKPTKLTLPAKLKLTGSKSSEDGGAIRFKHDFGTSGSELLSEALHYFSCRDTFERVALGCRPMSENASKVLHEKSGGQETLPRRLSDIRCVFEWYCPPVLCRGGH